MMRPVSSLSTLSAAALKLRARKLTIKYEPGDVIFFQMESGIPSGYFKIDENPGGPTLFLNTQSEPMHTDRVAEYLVRLVTD